MADDIKKICYFCDYYDEKSCYPSHGKCFHPLNNPNRKIEALKLVDGDETCEHWKLQNNKQILKILIDQSKGDIFF